MVEEARRPNGFSFLKQSDPLPLAEIFTRAESLQCHEYSKNDSFLESSICYAVAFALAGKDCSELLPRHLPRYAELLAEQEYRWKSAIIGFCRGVELTQAEFSIRRQAEPFDLPGDLSPLRSLNILKTASGKYPFFESALVTLALADYTVPDGDESSRWLQSLEKFTRATLRSTTPQSEPLHFIPAKHSRVGRLSAQLL